MYRCMTNPTFFQQHLAAAETALWKLKKQRDDIDQEIEALDVVIKIERALGVVLASER